MGSELSGVMKMKYWDWQLCLCCCFSPSCLEEFGRWRGGGRSEVVAACMSRGTDGESEMGLLLQ